MTNIDLVWDLMPFSTCKILLIDTMLHQLIWSNIWWITASWHALIIPTAGFSPLHHHSALGLGSTKLQHNSLIRLTLWRLINPSYNHQKIHLLMVFCTTNNHKYHGKIAGKKLPFICHLLWLMAFAMTQNRYQNVQSRSLAFHPKWTELCKMKAVQSFRFGSFDTQNW